MNTNNMKMIITTDDWRSFSHLHSEPFSWACISAMLRLRFFWLFAAFNENHRKKTRWNKVIKFFFMRMLQCNCSQVISIFHKWVVIVAFSSILINFDSEYVHNKMKIIPINNSNNDPNDSRVKRRKKCINRWYQMRWHSRIGMMMIKRTHQWK